MDGVVTKPLRQEELWKAIAECTSLSTNLNAGSPAETAANDVFDRSGLLERVGANAKLALEVLRLFQTEAEQKMEDLRGAIADRDLGRLYRGAHAIKGMLANLSAVRASEAAHRLETLSQDEQLAAAEEAYAKLVIEMDRLLPAIASFKNELDRRVIAPAAQTGAVT